MTTTTCPRHLQSLDGTLTWEIERLDDDRVLVYETIAQQTTFFVLTLAALIATLPTLTTIR